MSCSEAVPVLKSRADVYPLDWIEAVLKEAELPPSYRIMPRRHLTSGLGTTPADSRFCRKEDAYTVLYASPTSPLPFSKHASPARCRTIQTCRTCWRSTRLASLSNDRAQRRERAREALLPDHRLSAVALAGRPAGRNAVLAMAG